VGAQRAQDGAEVGIDEGLAEIDVLVRRAWEKRQLFKENAFLQSRLSRVDAVPEIITEYAPMQAVLQLVERVARGDSLTVETTALTVLAMIKNGQFANDVNQALTYLIKSKDPNGTWGSTSATILSLKALVASAEAPRVTDPVAFNILVGGKKVQSGEVNAKNADVMKLHGRLQMAGPLVAICADRDEFSHDSSQKPGVGPLASLDCRGELRANC